MWMPIAAAFAAGTLASFTDWLFMGVLAHKPSLRHPEVWRAGTVGGDNTKAIVWSTVVGYATPAAVIALCALAGARDYRSALTIAVLAWVAGPLTVTVTNGMWIKFAPMATLWHALGYLARFIIAGIAAAIVLPLQ